MIIGTLRIGTNSLHTHRDSYVLSAITAVSTRRPWLGAGLTVAALCGGFGLAFHDILTSSELLTLGAVGAFSLGIGLTFGQLRLISRDLRGSELSDAIYGTHAHLSALRLEIVHAVENAKTGGTLS